MRQQLKMLWKVFINEKMITKQSEKYITHMVLCLYNYFPPRIQCNETVSVFMYAIQKPATEKNSCEVYIYRSVNACCKERTMYCFM